MFRKQDQTPASSPPKANLAMGWMKVGEKSILSQVTHSQGWSSQQFLVELSRAKVARSLICWSRAEPKSSSLILLEPSWAQKLKFDIDRAEP